MLISGGELVLSDITPAFARTNYYPNTGLSLTAMFATYGELYKRQLWVYVVVNKRAKATARLPLKVYGRTDAGRQEARETPYARLLRKPNPKHDAFALWLWTSSTTDVFGEAIWAKLRGRDGKPVEVWPMHPSLTQIRVLPNEQTGENEVWYAFLGGIASSQPVLLFPERDIVHFKYYNPDTTVRGMSPLEPLRQTLVNEDAARRASSAFWANGARPSVVLSTANAIKNPDTIKRLKADWEAIHRGVDNFGKTAILEEGLKPEVLSLSAEEAQYESSRKLNREEVCAAYDIPPPVVHILDHATFSNITEQMRSMYRDTMAPHLGLFESTLDQQLRPDFGDDTVYAEFLMDEVMRGTFEERTDRIQAGINSGQITPNEARQLDNRPPKEGGETLFINSTMIPITAASSKTTPNIPASDLPAEQEGATPVKGLSVDQVRTIMGRLSRAKSLSDIDTDRLVVGLNGEGDMVREAVADSRSIADLKQRIKAMSPPGRWPTDWEAE